VEGNLNGLQNLYSSVRFRSPPPNFTNKLSDLL
jgi:hypothetical protein